MSDLFDPLREITREPVSSLSAAEVRRRGDRHRRRRTAVQVLGGAAAVTVVALGAYTMADGSPNSSREVPPASQRPSSSEQASGPVTRVPEGFPLDQGMVEAASVKGPSRDALWLTDVSICGDVAPYSPADVTTDAVGVMHDDTGYSQRRQLMVYPDAATAHRMARDLVNRFEACPRYDLDTGDTGHGEALNQVTPRELGDEAWTVKNGAMFNGAPTIGEDIYAVVRVGNAVLYSWAGAETSGLTNPPGFERNAQAELDGLAGPVAAMCVFTRAGCGSGPSPSGLPTDSPMVGGSFGPDTYGDLRLFLTPEEVADTGQATVNNPGTGPSPCRSLTYTGDEPGHIDGYVTSYGVEVLFAPDHVATPEGLGVGSSVSDLRRLYPDAEKVVSGFLIPLPGGQRYTALVDGDEVVALSLESNNQTCVR